MAEGLPALHAGLTVDRDPACLGCPVPPRAVLPVQGLVRATDRTPCNGPVGSRILEACVAGRLADVGGRRVLEPRVARRRGERRCHWERCSLLTDRGGGVREP